MEEEKKRSGIDIEITTTGVIGTLIIDGVDLSDKASAVTFKFEGGKLPLVTVDFLNIDRVHIKSSDSENYFFPQDYNDRYGDLKRPECESI